jgi:hypothetical protein
MSSASDSGLHIQPLPKLGQELGRFLIEKELPRGGQARVYRAWQTDLQRPVALKLLPSSYAVDQDAAARFKREIENVARISHPNIVRVYEAGEVEGHPFFTMEFLEGQDADSMVKRGPMDPDEAASIIEAVARAVHEAHGAGIIHRDIKPGNVILRKDGTPVLTDFGLAQDLSHSEQLTRTGISMGTPAYMAPEQARGERNRVGKKSDIYALGATLFSLLTGKRPVEGASAYELMLKVAEAAGPKWPRQAIEDIPADLRAIVEMAMQNDPAKRYESANDFADDLERFMHGEWVVARTRSPFAKLWVRSRRYLPVAAIVIVTLALAAGMVYTGLNPQLSTNDEGGFKTEDKPFVVDPLKTPAEVEELFRKNFETSGADVAYRPGGEIVVTRRGTDPIFLGPRGPTCWGDFTLTIEFQADNTSGPLEFRVGMADDNNELETAYVVVLQARSVDQYEVRRLGVPVLSGFVPGLKPVLEDDQWYRATIQRQAETLNFVLLQLPLSLPVASFTYTDDYPALISGRNATGPFNRQRFGISAESSELSLRDVTISHRDVQHSAEALLFSVGQYAEAELRLSARLDESLGFNATPEARNARAELLFLRARCRVQLERLEPAILDCSQAKQLVNDAELRSRLFLLGSQLETRRGDDNAALAQMRVAQFMAPGTSSRVCHDAHTRAIALQQAEPTRALLYLDYVAANGLGSPWLVCDSLYRSAQIRLADPATRQEAVAALELIESASYLRFGETFAPAVVLLFELRWEGLESDTAPVAETADWLAGAVNGYGVDDSLLTAPLVRAAWMGRLASEPANMVLWRKADNWLIAAGKAGADPLWLEFERALMGFERPELTQGLATRILPWRELAAQLELENPEHGVLAAVSDYFIGQPLDPADQARRNDVLRRALRREQATGHWLADAQPDRLADYCIALFEAPADRDQAVSRLEALAGATDAGALKLLKDRATRWLPIPG